VIQPEVCDKCGFDAADYTRSDLLGTLRALAPIWRTTTEGVAPSVLESRPAPAVWSAMEYAAHSRDVTAAMDLLLQLALTSDAPVLDPVPDQVPEPEIAPMMRDAIIQLDKQVARLNGKASRMDDADWKRTVTIGTETKDAAWIVAHAVHDATHHLRDVGRGLHALGAGAPTQHGRVVQCNASTGGVPKAPLARATVDRRGVFGDRQADRNHHGRPLQALSLWSADVIDALRSEGHTVHPGAAGENVTVAGIDWTTIRPGVRVDLGAVRIEISAFATPCAKNAQWFSDRDFRRIDHDRHPGWSRAYAWVLSGGEIAPGDDVVVEPPPPEPGDQSR
jgi:MOSC domain-containing protein YiiM